MTGGNRTRRRASTTVTATRGALASRFHPWPPPPPRSATGTCCPASPQEPPVSSAPRSCAASSPRSRARSAPRSRSSPSCSSSAPATRSRSRSSYPRGMELREGHEFALAGTPCAHAYQRELLLVRSGARECYPDDDFLAEHGIDGYLAIPLRGARLPPDRPPRRHLHARAGPGAARAAGAAGLRRAGRSRARAPPPRARPARPPRRGGRLTRPRRARRRRGAPPDRARPARRRAAAARRPRPGAGSRAARARATTRGRRSSG